MTSPGGAAWSAVIRGIRRQTATRLRYRVIPVRVVGIEADRPLLESRQKRWVRDARKGRFRFRWSPRWIVRV